MKNIRLPVFWLLVSISIINSCSNSALNPEDVKVKNPNYAAYKSFSYNVGINEQTAFVLDGINGPVYISPTINAQAASISGERRVQSESEQDANAFLEYLKVTVEDRGDEVYVHTEQPGNTQGRILTVTYYIKMPAEWAATINNTNGDIQIDSLNGTIKVNITNGNIILNEIHAGVDAALVNGTIDGHIILPESGTCNMDLTNGAIYLDIPHSTNAAFNAKIVNGSVNVNNLIMQNVSYTSTTYTGTLGTGDGTIELQAVNGSINVLGY